MKENRYHIDESKFSDGMVNEPAAAYRDAAVAEPTMHHPTMDWDDSLKDEDDEAFNTDSYPMGRSLEQVMAHCEEVEKHWNDPNYWHPVDDFIDRLEQKIAQWR